MMASSFAPLSVEPQSLVLTAKPRGRRSRGCITCRQRKVKCDEKLPHCLRCLNSSRECLGYGNPQLFINQVLATTPSAKTEEKDMKVVTKFSTTGVNFPLTLSPDIGGQDVVISHLINKFPIDFAWRLPPGAKSSPLSAIFTSLSRRATAYVSGICLAQAFYARAHKRHDLMAHATILYSRSLQHLRQDLQVLDRSTSAVSMYSNLWSSFLLCLYEIVSGVSSAGWLEHCHGITALIQMLGPHAFQELGANLMLETYRGLIIVNFLVKRKRCFLEAPDWKTVPWTIKRKSLGSQLQDLFCDVPGLMEEVDEIMQQSALGHETDTMEENLREKVSILMEQTWQFRWQWEAANANACKEVTSAEYGSSSSRDRGPSPFPTVFHFQSMDRAIDIAFFNTIQLLLDTLLDPLGPRSTPFLSPSQPPTGPFTNPLLLPGQGSRDDHALEICRIVDFMSHCKHDSLGMFMLMFPLYVARSCLVQRPDVSAWITNILSTLVREKGFHIGGHLSKEE
ncbi:hypothetical protein N5P37_011112 [Trichoderma harzianum]|nr:hypothetical protein N5P37_011112 [Trichoderma harzianum]